MRLLATRHDNLIRAARFARDAHDAARDMGALVPPFDQNAALKLYTRVTGLTHARDADLRLILDVYAEG